MHPQSVLCKRISELSRLIWTNRARRSGRLFGRAGAGYQVGATERSLHHVVRLPRVPVADREDRNTWRHQDELRALRSVVRHSARGGWRGRRSAGQQQWRDRLHDPH